MNLSDKCMQYEMKVNTVNSKCMVVAKKKLKI